jgi:hypothetical protein
MNGGINILALAGYFPDFAYDSKLQYSLYIIQAI